MSSVLVLEGIHYTAHSVYSEYTGEESPKSRNYTACYFPGDIKLVALASG